MKNSIKVKSPNVGYYNELEYAYRYDSFFDIDPNNRDSKTIYVAIPVYRDPEVVATVHSIYLNAKNPERVFVGIGLIYNDFDEEYWKELEQYPNVKINIQKSTIETIGLGRQRETANSFYNKENYYLQTDAHMRFDMHWDDLYIHQLENLKTLGDPKPLITGYPRGYCPDGPYNVEGMYPYFNPMSKELYFREQSGSTRVPCLRTGTNPPKFFKESGFPRHGDRHFSKGETLALSNTLSPAQIFTDGSFVKDVPANPNIRFLEEEQYYAILSYMKGYNFYVPRVTPIMHFYTNHGEQVLISRPHPQQEFPDAFDIDSYDPDNLGGIQIFNKLKSMKNTTRSFKDYENFANIDYDRRVLIAPVDRIYQNKITAAINFISELDLWCDTDYSNWMYDDSYEFYDDVVRNEKL